MKSSFKSYGLLITIVLSISILGFYFSSDIKKAQIALSILGMHEENKEDFAKVSGVIKLSGHNCCLERDKISKKNVELIENHFNNDPEAYFQSSKHLRIEDVYAANNENWDAGCMTTGLPRRNFEYLIYSDKSIIISFENGGLARSLYLDFFEINEDGLELVGCVNSSGNSLFDLALQLRFNKNLI